MVADGFFLLIFARGRFGDVYLVMKNNVKTGLALWMSILFLQGLSAQVTPLDQIGDPLSYDLSASIPPNVSQIFSDFRDFDSLALDDFQIEGEDLTIRTVQALIFAQSGFDSFDSVSGYQLSFFDDPSLASMSLSGNIVDESIIAGSSVSRLGDTDFAILTLVGEWELPSEGTYWVGVAPEAPFSVAGQFMLANGGAGVDGGSNGLFVNPENGFGGGTSQVVAADFAYLVSTEAIPEPGVAGLVAVAILFGAGRRRRG